MNEAATARAFALLMVSARYLPEQGGTEIHTHEVARRLAARGIAVTVLTTELRPPGRTEEIGGGGVRVVRVRAWPRRRDYYVAPQIIRAIRGKGLDLVHCQGYHTFVAPLAMATAATARIPYLVTLHSGGHSSRLRRRLRPLQAWVLRPLLRRASAVIAASRFEAELFARWLRLPISDFAVIPSGVDLPPTEPGVLPQSPPLILSVGRAERYKGHDRVVEALPAVEDAHPGVSMRVVGTGGYERELRRLAHRLGVGDRLEIEEVPPDRRGDLGELIQRAGVVVSLSEYESQGMAVQEAVGLGRPVVVSDNSALAELARHPNVQLVPGNADNGAVAAAILEALDAPAVQPPAMPTWEQCVAALLELYERALTRRA